MMQRKVKAWLLMWLKVKAKAWRSCDEKGDEKGESRERCWQQNITIDTKTKEKLKGDDKVYAQLMYYVNIL